MASNAAADAAAAAVTGAARKDKGVTGTATGLAQDDLSRKQLQRLYGYTSEQLKVDPSLFSLFERAFKGQWDKARFQSELEQSEWYMQNAAPVREYMLLEAKGGADFDQKRADSVEAVRQRAMKMGVNLSHSVLADLAERSMMFGWGQKGREYQLDQEISKAQSETGNYGGDIQMNVDNLKALAAANNVKLDDAWYMSKARSIAGGLSLADDAEREVRRFAAEKSPGFAVEIMNGENLDALATPWRRVMADEWDLAPESIDLGDPMLQSAIGGFGEDGKPAKMNLGAFQQKLRKDPRWLETDSGQNKTVSAYSEVMKMFGVGN